MSLLYNFAGMIAPMETVISAAMYHDIAAMKLKGQKKWVRDHYVFYFLFNKICEYCVSFKDDKSSLNL